MQNDQGVSEILNVVSMLVLGPGGQNIRVAVDDVKSLPRQALLEICEAHHVVLRALAPVLQCRAKGCPAELLEWVAQVTAAERERIGNALPVLHEICLEFERAGLPLVVIKTFDHWPDFGNDIDLYTIADERAATDILRQKFRGTELRRSWGDHLAHKWSFEVPGMKPPVELHINRLGQVGEHVQLARRFLDRSVVQKANEYTFRVPAPEERVIAATLQRMYRHLYFRICDVVNTATLLEAGAIDYGQLAEAAELGGIASGVATYLTIVSEYRARYAGRTLPLPEPVTAATVFHCDRAFVRGKYMHLPVLPDGFKLYRQQWAQSAARGDLSTTLRLAAVVPLASAAALSTAMFGSCERIW